MSAVEVINEPLEPAEVVSGVTIAGVSSVATDSETEVIIVPDQGPPGLPGPPGTPGQDGNSILYGGTAPSTIIGQDGDFYINTTTHFIYGPKAFGVWPAGTSMVGPAGPTGATGSQGPPGATGSQGPRGNAVLYGTGVPTVGIGIAGDFYIDMA